MLAVERTVACSANVVVLLPTIRAFRCGCMLDVEVVPKQGTLSKDHWWNLHMSVYGGFLGKRRGARLPNKLLRLDVRYADGTKATSAARAGWVARNASMSAVLTVAQSVMAVAEEDRKIARSRIVVRWPSIMECWRAECRHGVPGSARPAHARRASRLLAATLPAYQRAVSHRHLAGQGPSKHASGQGRKHWLIRDARPDHREKSDVGDPIVGWLLAVEVSDEVVPATAQPVRLVHMRLVVGVRDDEHVEVLVRGHKRINQPQGHVGVNIVVQFPMDEQQLAFSRSAWVPLA